MAEDTQFHMTVVTQKRVRREEGSQHPAAGGNSRPSASDEGARHSSEGAHHSSEGARHSQEGSHHSSAGAYHSRESARADRSRADSRHRRHYQDFGTVDLGNLNDERPAREASARDFGSGAPSRGELQRDFFDRYDTALSRRYNTRNKGKVARIVFVSLLIALVILVSMILLANFKEQGTDALAKPQVETIPVVTLNLGS